MTRHRIHLELSIQTKLRNIYLDQYILLIFSNKSWSVNEFNLSKGKNPAKISKSIELGVNDYLNVQLYGKERKGLGNHHSQRLIGATL